MTTKLITDNTERIEKLDSTITSIIDQIEYLATSTTIESDKKRAGFDPTRDKIRSNSDLIFQLSNSLSSIMAVKHNLAYYDKLNESKKDKEEEDVLLNLLMGKKRGSNKNEPR